ncbi:MAG: pentapeptide repeat-containing protein [Planctomycetaceae bacterium]|nr:pentapeptide repeat-containing protein [Planctomycetaceae bacterium]
MSDTNALEPIDPTSPDHCRPTDHPSHLPWPPKILENYNAYKASAEKHVQEWEKSAKAFHDDLAVEAFGEDFMNNIRGKQTHYNLPSESKQTFQGDWFQLAFLLRCHEAPLEQRKTRDTGKGRIYSIYNYSVPICACPFCQFDWDDIHLEKANLISAHLEYAHLWNAHLEDTNISDAHLEGAILWEAHLENATLKNAHLGNADIQFAHLEDAELYEAHLENAILWEAHLENADILNANLTGAELRFAVLDRADVRGAKGIIFDCNNVERLIIEGNAPDPWSVLRRRYTGPSFFFHILLLVAFFIPYISKAVVLTGVHEGMELIDKKGVQVLEKLEQHTDYQTPLHGAVDKAVKKLPKAEGLVESLQEKTDSKINALPSISAYFKQLRDMWKNIKKQTAFWTLVGFGNWKFGTFSFFLITLLMIAYNFLRLKLTRDVSALRDAEERAKITPSRQEYMGKTDQKYDSCSFWTASWEAMKLWYAQFAEWRKQALSTWRDACHSALHKLWNVEVWVWEQRKSKIPYIVTMIVVIIFGIFSWLDSLFLYLGILFLLIVIIGMIFGLGLISGWWKGSVEKESIDFRGVLLPPSPIKYLGLYRLHQIANVFMIIGYGALAIQIVRWLWFTQIPTY